MIPLGKWAFRLFVAAFAAFSAGAAEVSYVRIDLPKLLDSPIAMDALAAWPGGAPVVERFRKYADELGIDLKAVAPVAILLPDFDEASRSVMLLRFPEGAQAILGAAAEKTGLFQVSDGTSGKIFCLNHGDQKSPGGAPLRFVAVFVSPRLAWAGEELAVEEWRLRTAGGPGQFFPDPFAECDEAVVFSLRLSGRGDVRKLFGGVERVDGKLAVKADSLALSVCGSGGDLNKFSGVVQGFYLMGVNLLFGRDQELRDTLCKKPVFDVKNDVFSARIELERALIDRMVALLRDEELPAPDKASPEAEVW